MSPPPVIGPRDSPRKLRNKYNLFHTFFITILGGLVGLWVGNGSFLSTYTHSDRRMKDGCNAEGISVEELRSLDPLRLMEMEIIKVHHVDSDLSIPSLPDLFYIFPPVSSSYPYTMLVSKRLPSLQGLPNDLTPQLISFPASPGSSDGFVLHTLRVKKPEEECKRKKQCDLWAYVWGSTYILAQGLLFLAPSLPPHLKILEIGGGSGYSSMVASRLGHEVYCTDLVEDALQLCRANGQINGCTSLHTFHLDWNQPSFPDGFSVDMIIAADVIYMRRAIQPILKICKTVLRPTGMMVIVDPGRPNADEFEDEAIALGLQVKRYDVLRISTPICDMVKCTVFVVSPQPLGDVPIDEWFDYIASLRVGLDDSFHSSFVLK